MSPSRSSSSAHPNLVFAGRALVCVVALAAAGCASNEAYRQQGEYPGYPQSVYAPQDQHGQPGAAAPDQVASAPPVEIEDDGLPSQLPPPARSAAEADDPTEPFSRNYGSAPNPGNPNSGQRGARRAAASVGVATTRVATLAAPIRAVHLP